MLRVLVTPPGYPARSRVVCADTPEDELEDVPVREQNKIVNMVRRLGEIPRPMRDNAWLN